MIGKLCSVRFRILTSVAQWPLWLAGIYVSVYVPSMNPTPLLAAGAVATVLNYIDRHVAPVSRAYRNGYRAGYEDALETCAQCRSAAAMPDPVYPTLAAGAEVLSLRGRPALS